MPQWGKNDVSSNTPKWAASTIEAGSGAAAKAANNTALYSNTTADAFVKGQTIGVFGISKAEVAGAPGSSSGWVMRRQGSGGRAGRVSYEVLVAMNGLSGSDYSIVFDTQPANTSANSYNHDIATFSSVVVTAPTGGAITYQWQANTGAGFANVANGAVYSNVGTNTLIVSNTFGLNAASYQLTAFVTGAVNAISGSAKLTVTDYSIVFDTQPANTSANSTNSDTATFGATVHTVPGGGSITYQWQANTGAGFANVVNGAVYADVTTNTLTVSETTGLNAASYQLRVFATGAVNVVSGSATLTVTT